MSDHHLTLSRLVRMSIPSGKAGAPPAKNFPWFDELVNAGIIGGIAAFSTFVAAGDGDVPFKAFAIAFAMSFLGRLAMRRGLV